MVHGSWTSQTAEPSASNYTIEYNVGVGEKKVYEVKKLNLDDFEE